MNLIKIKENAQLLNAIYLIIFISNLVLFIKMIDIKINKFINKFFIVIITIDS